MADAQHLIDGVTAPFQHSEALADQDKALQSFEALGDAPAIDFARKHRDMIARFGRFPHRNAALGRETRPKEQTAAAKGSHW